MSIVSMAAIVDCFAVCWSSGSSERFRFPSVTVAAFHGTGGKAIPFLVLKEKHSYVLCLGLPHLQQSLRLWAYSSCSLVGTPTRASSFVPQ